MLIYCVHFKVILIRGVSSVKCRYNIFPSGGYSSCELTGWRVSLLDGRYPPQRRAGILPLKNQFSIYTDCNSTAVETVILRRSEHDHAF